MPVPSATPQEFALGLRHFSVLIFPRGKEWASRQGIPVAWHEKSYGHCESFMRIMVFMTPDGETSSSPDAFNAKTIRALPSRTFPRWFRWIPAAIAYGWIAVSTQATVNAPALHSRPESWNVVTSTLSVIPGQEAFYPILGLLAAVASTCFLRRRRLAQLEATAATER